MPGHLFEESRRRLRPTHVGPHHAPEITETLAGMPDLGIGIRGDTHLGPILRLPDAITLDSEHDGDHGTLAVVRVACIRTVKGLVFAVVEVAPVHAITEEAVGPLHRGIDLGIFQSATFTEDDGQVGRRTTLVHGAIGRDGTMQFSVLGKSGYAVSEGSKHALTLGQGDGDLIEGGLHRLVAGLQVIFTEEDAEVSHVPYSHADFGHVVFEGRGSDLLGDGLDLRQVAGIASR